MPRGGRARSVRGAYRVRRGRVKGGTAAVWKASTQAAAVFGGGLLRGSPRTDLTQEHTMADVAFVVTTIAVFALVALVARGVTKL